MRAKKIFLTLVVIFSTYLIGSYVLVKMSLTDGIYLFPGFENGEVKWWKIKPPSEKSDKSKFSSDGPIIFYNKDSVFAFSVVPKDSDFIVTVNEINKKEEQICYIDETKQSFTFYIKDSLEIEQHQYPLPEKMIIISDIEGNFKGFHSILKGAKVINDKFEWIFGNGHLVLNGDFFDRGLNVTECLWLIYKLENDAKIKGGKVHFLLGNHEVMNLQGDYKYVRQKYLINADSIRLNYKDWFSRSSELGRWLRTKNSIEKIGDYLILHGGLKKDFPKKSLNEINKEIRQRIDLSKGKDERKEDLFIGAQSPLWYRGIILEKESQNDIEKTLQKFKSRKMILGHTIVNKIKYLYDKKVIAIDIEHSANSRKGIMYALYYENNLFYQIDNKGNKTQLK